MSQETKNTISDARHYLIEGIINLEYAVRRFQKVSDKESEKKVQSIIEDIRTLEKEVQKKLNSNGG